ncbi:MAG: radical SAM protein, partial [Thermodesulfovibrionales bacterium]|nr:radical SAM protein [Thermodesulfovibrionales bacterium]
MAKVQCELCPTECVLGEYEVGVCRVRINKGGVLYSLVYGKPCAVQVDPIEKKPFYHFLPASTAFSIATAGCVLGCKFCQN